METDEESIKIKWNTFDHFGAIWEWAHYCLILWRYQILPETSRTGSYFFNRRAGKRSLGIRTCSSQLWVSQSGRFLDCVPSERPFRVPAVRPPVSPPGAGLSSFSASCSILSTCCPLICPVFIWMYCLPSGWWVTSFSCIYKFPSTEVRT